jgi:hypothetical protein
MAEDSTRRSSVACEVHRIGGRRGHKLQSAARNVNEPREPLTGGENIEFTLMICKMMDPVRSHL